MSNPNPQEMVGKSFQNWNVVEYVGTNSGGNSIYRCRCKCGHVGIRPGTVLRLMKTRGCKSCAGKRRIKDMTGKRFGSWTILRFDSIGQDGKAKWLCRCDCGSEHSVIGKDIRSGKSTKCVSCGATDHGLCRESVYRVHINMLDRCENKNNDAYKRYGGRGISVCDAWHDVTVFYNWCMSNGWKKGLQIDRIDNDGNYEPANCRFVTPKQNCRNRVNTVYCTLYGITLPAIEWAERIGVSPGMIYDRKRAGWSDFDAVMKLPRGEKR